MKPSNELFELIKTLTKSEKRFFKLSSSLQSGDKNYLKIFDTIDRQKDYDEENIKEMFKGETFIKHFPSEKNHLYKLILKSLRSYHSDDSISSLMKQEIKNIEILYKKALYKECNKFLKRAKKLAIEHEKFYYLFELLAWEKILLEEAYESGEFTRDLDELIQEEKDVIEKLRNLAAYHILYSKINYVFRSGGYVRSDKDRQVVAEISEHPLITEKSTALSKRATTICYYIKGFCSLANRDRKSAVKHFLKVKDILDKNKLIRQDLQKRYVLTINNLITCNIQLRDYKAVEGLLIELKQIGNTKGFDSLDIKTLVFRATALAELKMYNTKGDFPQADGRIEEIIEEFENFKTKINKEQEILFYHNISLCYFGREDYNKALFWINKVLNDNESNLRQDIYSFARLFNLVVHYELGNFDLLDYIIKSTGRYLNKRNRAYEVENVIMSGIRRLSKAFNEEETSKILDKFNKDLKELFKDPTERVVLEYFDFQAWINSKLSDLTFAEAVRAAS